MTSEADSTNQTTSSVLHQVLSETGEPLFEVEIPHDWRYEASRSFSKAWVDITTLQPDGREVAVKLGTEINEYEYRSLQFVWSASARSTKCPEPIAFFSLPETQMPLEAPRNPQSRRKRRGFKLLACNVIIMSRIPGVPLSEPLPLEMDSKTRSDLVREAVAWMDWLNGCLRQQGIYPPVPGCFSDIDGRRCLDLPLLDDFVNHPIPETVATDGSVTLPDYRGQDGQILNHIRDNVLACITRQDAERPSGTIVVKGQSFSPTGPQAIRFCHMDLHAGNIMILPVAEQPGSTDDRHESEQGERRWRFSGLVDWEYAGWYTARLEAYAGIFRPWADYGSARPVNPKGYKRLTYVEYEAQQWSADVELAEAAGSARLSLHDCRQRRPDQSQSR